ncbi:hypothetical protein MIND_01089600 [Mycena indigotica]|uniref:Uncharacterized protein n=1 Tax=Mycena indigotica TaxID=2126181 RepID=A0A8H6SBX1_9AGAR|nr:uncharacterized protein MIND_01089600 [Mycena indigotica]KAF7295497.1 hypothetical protein MIND_01089600 [Mycena indigotica]
MLQLSFAVCAELPSRWKEQGSGSSSALAAGRSCHCSRRHLICSPEPQLSKSSSSVLLFDALYWGVNLGAFKLVVLLLPGGLVDGARFGLQAVLTVWTFHRLLLVPNEFDLPRGTTGPRNCSRLRALAFLLFLRRAGEVLAFPPVWASLRVGDGYLLVWWAVGWRDLVLLVSCTWSPSCIGCLYRSSAGLERAARLKRSFACPAGTTGHEIARVCSTSVCTLLLLLLHDIDVFYSFLWFFGPAGGVWATIQVGDKSLVVWWAEAARELRESFDRLYLSSAGTEHAARLKRVRGMTGPRNGFHLAP